MHISGYTGIPSWGRVLCEAARVETSTEFDVTSRIRPKLLLYYN